MAWVNSIFRLWVVLSGPGTQYAGRPPIEVVSDEFELVAGQSMLRLDESPFRTT